MKVSASYSIISIPPLQMILKTRYHEVMGREMLHLLEKMTGGRGAVTPPRQEDGLIHIEINHPELKRVVVRPAKRRGLVAPILKDLHWGKCRALQELDMADRAFNAGLPTPEILGIAFKSRGFGFYETYIIMKEITDVLGLPDYLTRLPAGYEHKIKLLEAVLRTLLQFQKAGFYHPDLNLKNILVSNEHGPKIWIVDMDKVSHHPKLTYEQRINNLARLTRSLAKLGLDKVITPANRLWFLKHYLELIGDNQPERVRQISIHCSLEIERHQRWWHLTGDKKNPATDSTD